VSPAANPRLVVAGALSGAVWFCLALAFDKGVQDFNYPVIPFDRWQTRSASFLSAVITGVLVALIFRTSWMSESRWSRWVVPYLAIPVAITIFSGLLRLVVLTIGDRPDIYTFEAISGNLGIYALISMFAPVLYGVAQLNRLAMRAVLTRAPS
jgi:divalent metal cation (Fe/Co/Zn/Cd) transporter